MVSLIPTDTVTRQNYRCNDGGLDAVLRPLNSKGLRERDQAHLRSGVVRLAKVAVQPGSGGGVDDPAEFLFSENGPSGLCARKGTLEVDGLNLVPFRV